MSEWEDTREYTERNMLEYVLSPSNLNAACKQVVRNQGAGEIDEMEVSEQKDYLAEHKEQLLESVLRGSYQPQAVKGVEIPKNDGGKCKLGIPTVIDIDTALRETVFGQRLWLSPETERPSGIEESLEILLMQGTAMQSIWTWKSALTQ